MYSMSVARPQRAMSASAGVPLSSLLKQAVLQYFVCALAEAFVPHHHWNVGKVAQGVHPGVNDGCVFDSLVFGIACGDCPDVCVLHFEACARSGPARASFNAQATAAGGNRAQEDRIGLRKSSA